MTTFSDIAANISGVYHVRHAVLTFAGTYEVVGALPHQSSVQVATSHLNQIDFATTAAA